MLKLHLLLTVAVLALLATAANADGLERLYEEFEKVEFSAVEALAPTVATGVAASYRVAEYGAFAAWVDAGTLLVPQPDPFLGASTNIPPVDKWLQQTLNADMRWGYGYLFSRGTGFAYTRLRVEVSF